MSRDLERGDVVIATRSVGGWLFPRVGKGTEGVVIDTSGWLATTYTVRFDSGETVDCDRDEIKKIK